MTPEEVEDEIEAAHQARLAALSAVRLIFRSTGNGPRVFMGDEEVTLRCYSVEIQPGGLVTVGLFKLNENGQKYFVVEGDNRELARESIIGRLDDVSKEA